ncbi:hypothetical protein MD484_g4887, partial [Candolleomyces efflorescens]
MRPRSPMGGARGRSGSFSALGGAVAEFLSPDRRRLYLGSAVGNSRWQNTTFQGSGSAGCVLFDMKRSKGQGIPMNLLMNPKPELAGDMTGANDHVLVNAGVTQITFHIVWSGYKSPGAHHICSIDALEKGIPVTRLMLATKICRLFYDYLKAREGEPSVNSALAIGPGKIQFEKLVLVGLHPVQGSNWQADIACDF